MKIGFICTHNSARSIMAEALARKLFKEALLDVEVFSAGSKPAKEINPIALKVLEKFGYDTKNLYPKAITDIPYEDLDIVITLCGDAKDECPYVPSHKRREHWGLEDPSKSSSEEVFIETLKKIEENLRNLLKLK